MRRRTASVIGLVLLVLGGLGALMASTAQPGPTYAVTQVLAGLHRQPTAWLDRPLRVRGRLSLCSPGNDCGYFGYLDDEHTRGPSLYLVGTVEPAALGVVRRVPLLNQLLPPDPLRAWGRRGTYTVTIYGVNAPTCPNKGLVVMSPPYCVVLSDTWRW